MLTWYPSLHLVGSDLILLLPRDQRELQRDLDGDLRLGHVQVQVDLYVQEYDLIAILNLLALLSVLVTGENLEVDGLGRLLYQLDLVASFFVFSTSFLRTEVRF